MAENRPSRTDRRNEILAKAAELFARNGFHGVSIDDLGTAVGMTGPALYRYFAGKEAILSAILVDISERLLSGGRQRAGAHSEDPAAALEALVAFHVDFALDNTNLIDVQMRDLDAMPEEEQRNVRRLQSQYVGLWVDALCDRQALDRDAALAGAHAAFGLINSTPHSARLSRPEMASLLQSMAMAALASIPLPE